jgi:hypothetical protein
MGRLRPFVANPIPGSEMQKGVRYTVFNTIIGARSLVRLPLEVSDHDSGY